MEELKLKWHAYFDIWPDLLNDDSKERREHVVDDILDLNTITDPRGCHMQEERLQQNSRNFEPCRGVIEEKPTRRLQMSQTTQNCTIGLTRSARLHTFSHDVKHKK